MNYEIVFFDVDGTLIDNDVGVVGLSTINAVKSLTERGVKVVIATGRPYSLAKPIGDYLGVNNYITCNGAHVVIDGKEIHKTVMPEDKLQQLVDRSKKLNDGLVLFDSYDAYYNGNEKDCTIPAMRRIGHRDYFKDINYSNNGFTGGCLITKKGNINGYHSLTEVISFYKWVSYSSHVYDIQIKEVDKIDGVIKVLDNLGIDKEKSIAFGDGYNDVEMLKGVGKGIAMGNAGEQLKNIADFVTKSVNDNGIEFALKKLQLV